MQEEFRRERRKQHRQGSGRRRPFWLHSSPPRPSTVQQPARGCLPPAGPDGTIPTPCRRGTRPRRALFAERRGGARRRRSFCRAAPAGASPGRAREASSGPADCSTRSRMSYMPADQLACVLGWAQGPRPSLWACFGVCSGGSSAQPHHTFTSPRLKPGTGRIGAKRSVGMSVPRCYAHGWW